MTLRSHRHGACHAHQLVSCTYTEHRQESVRMCKRGTHTRPAMHLSCSTTASGSHSPRLSFHYLRSVRIIREPCEENFVTFEEKCRPVDTSISIKSYVQLSLELTLFVPFIFGPGAAYVYAQLLFANCCTCLYDMFIGGHCVA